MHNRQRRKRRMISEINVVPYIDVMLVLLIIFMITAPLITQGVNVELPKAPSDVLSPSELEPIIVSVDARGDVFVDISEVPDKPVDDQTLTRLLAVVLQRSPETEVLIEGDSGVGYGRVVEVMSLIQAAGAAKVGLITEPVDL